MKIPFQYDVGQIIAPIKGKDIRLWEALNNLNNASRAFNDLIGNLKALNLYERITFKIPATAAGADVERYVVKMPFAPPNEPITASLTIVGMLLTSKAASAGDVIDIQVSNNRGTTFNSILKTTALDPSLTFNLGTLPAGLTLMQYGVGQFSRNTFFDNDFLRADYVSGTAADEITIDLFGSYSLL